MGQQYEIDTTQLALYLSFTLLSIVCSMVFYLYVMQCTDINQHDREEINSLVYNFIVEREEYRGERTQTGNASNLSQKLI